MKQEHTQIKDRQSAQIVTLAISVLKGVHFLPSVQVATTHLLLRKYALYVLKAITVQRGLLNPLGVNRELTLRKGKQLVSHAQQVLSALRALPFLNHVRRVVILLAGNLNVRRVRRVILALREHQFQLNVLEGPTVKQG